MNGIEFIEDLPGVEFKPPPFEKLTPIMDALNAEAKSALTGDKKFAIISIFNETSINAAIVAKTKFGFEVEAWVGKSWKGSAHYGAKAKIVF